ncbi:hypothetical protein EVG20_g392 [Dentipellis fragilis]|uniref:Uncharacterized protein n=1 Tax=Dentipellis fragilis TaxID=205917 RepID=A0A4Y9ZDT5_9AGAM|nr:hypothetical protein EVG20_g392 [Dentipellis fragilis]
MASGRKKSKKSKKSNPSPVQKGSEKLIDGERSAELAALYQRLNIQVPNGLSDADQAKLEELMRSGTIQWFEKAKIPISFLRKRATKDTWLSASKATVKMLQRDCSWDFRNNPYNTKNRGTLKITEAINATTRLLSSSGTDALTITIPPSWLVQRLDVSKYLPIHIQGSTDYLPKETLALRVSELQVQNAQPELSEQLIAPGLSPIITLYNCAVKTEAAGRNELFVPLADPTDSDIGTNAESNADRKVQADPSTISIQKIFLDSRKEVLSVNTVMAALTIGRAATEIGSEMSVERRVGSILRGIFLHKDCRLLENNALNYPLILGLWASTAKPDLACRLKKFGKNSPVILVGEAKKDVKPQSEMPVAQLACAVQPTLQLFAAYLTSKYNKDSHGWSEDWNPLSKSNPAQVPAWMRIHGMCYDRRGFTFHVFFPQYTVKGNDVIWSFVCRKLPMNSDTEEMLRDVFKDNMMASRAELLKVLCLLKSEALKTATHIRKELELPDCLVKLEEGWKWEPEDADSVVPVPHDPHVPQAAPYVPEEWRRMARRVAKCRRMEWNLIQLEDYVWQFLECLAANAPNNDNNNISLTRHGCDQSRPPIPSQCLPLRMLCTYAPFLSNNDKRRQAIAHRSSTLPAARPRSSSAEWMLVVTVHAFARSRG